MPQLKSAAKELRKSRKRYEKNRRIWHRIKDLRKKIKHAVATPNTDEARKLFHDLQKVVDKASKSGGFLDRNTANRYKSRIANRIRKVAAKT